MEEHIICFIFIFQNKHYLVLIIQLLVDQTQLFKSKSKLIKIEVQVISKKLIEKENINIVKNIFK